MNWEDEIRSAAKRIKEHVRSTPVVSASCFGENVTLKLEQMQHTGSFKARGAFNTLLSCDIPSAGIVAASGGNHGAAVAYAARQLGIPAHVFVPEVAGPSKIALIRETGANLEVVEGTYANALIAAQEFETRTGAMQIHAYDEMPTVVGQGTMALEWEAQIPEADTWLVAVGGGGLLAGAMAWIGARRNVVAVEPEKCAALNAALDAGAPVDVDVSGVAVNALGARRIGNICFDLARSSGVQSVTVPDDAITEAQKRLWQSHRQLVEPAGATALAALLCGAYQPKAGETVSILTCGANIAPDPFQDV